MKSLYEAIKNRALYLPRLLKDYLNIPDIEGLSSKHQQEKETRMQEVEQRKANHLKALEQGF